MGIIQNKLECREPGDPQMTTPEAIYAYISVIDTFKNYFKNQNPYYIEEIQKLNTAETAELLKQKIQRLKNFYLSRNKVLIFGAFLEIITWAAIGHTTYKATQ